MNYGRLLLWAAVIVAVPRWAGAFIAADVAEMPAWVSEGLHIASLVSGIGMGILEVVAAAYMLEAWSRLKPYASHNAKSINYRWKILTGFIIGLFVLMPFILAPYVVSRINSSGIGEALGGNNTYIYVWSIAVVLSPAFIVGGVAAASDDLVQVKQSKQPKVKAESKSQKSAGEKAKQKNNDAVEVAIISSGSDENTKAAEIETILINEARKSKDEKQLSNAAIGRMVGTSGQYVGQIRKELNGALK